MRTEFDCQRMRRRIVLVVAAMVAGYFALAPRLASAEGLFDFFFGGAQKQQARQAFPLASFFADPLGLNQQPVPAPPHSDSWLATLGRSIRMKLTSLRRVT